MDFPEPNGKVAVWDLKHVDWYMSRVLPPGVSPPKPVARIGYPPGSEKPPKSFEDAMRLALKLIREYNKPLLLDVLRKKWPEAAAKYEASKALAA